ncbi:MAG: hypothetical protein LBQ50_00060 [Planctomycetaceae bacterium]|jgi:hypothetical protein|nr:hypothetical protein [Planctomycetaceae bacterium]
MPNFFEASRRHFSDAEYLQNDNRLPNAGQLYGFSAECGIKALIEKTGAKPTKDHAHQLVNLLPTLQIEAQGRLSAQYLAKIDQKKFNAWGTWHTDQRYEAEKDISQMKDFNDWYASAKNVSEVLEEGRIDGVFL